MVRSFIAIEIKPSREILHILDEIDGMGMRIKTVERENMHLTLKFLGEIDEALVEKISGDMQNIEKYPGFSIHLCGVGAFPTERNPRVLWIGMDKNETLKEIWKEIEGIAEKYGINREKRGFSPHITIGRVKGRRRSPRFREFLERHRNDDFGIFDVREIKLKKSTLTPDGPIYSDLHIVGLRG